MLFYTTGHNAPKTAQIGTFWHIFAQKDCKKTVPHHKDFVGVNIFSCEVSERSDVLRTLGKRQLNLQRVIVCISKDTVLRNVFD